MIEGRRRNGASVMADGLMRQNGEYEGGNKRDNETVGAGAAVLALETPVSGLRIGSPAPGLIGPATGPSLGEAILGITAIV